MASDRNPANSEQFDAAAVREASGALGSGAGAGAGGVGASGHVPLWVVVYLVTENRGW